MKFKCCNCGKMTEKWQRVNGSPASCYDGCFSTTGEDYRTTDGSPAWEPKGNSPAWDPKRIKSIYR